MNSVQFKFQKMGGTGGTSVHELSSFTSLPPSHDTSLRPQRTIVAKIEVGKSSLSNYVKDEELTMVEAYINEELGQEEHMRMSKEKTG